MEESLQLEPFRQKTAAEFKKNLGFKEMSNIAKILKGETIQKDERVKLLSDPALLANFASAPITSVDLERFFSSIKDLLSYKRLRLTEEHVKDQMMVQWNKDVIKEPLYSC